MLRRAHAMRILFLTHRLPFAPNRGDRIRAYHMLQFLGRHATVDLLSLVHDDEEAGESLESLPVRRVTIVRTTPWRNRLRSVLALPGPVPLTHTLLHSPGLLPAVREASAACTPDVVLAYCSGIAPAALLPPLDTVPLVLDMVDVDSAKWRSLGRTDRTWRRWIYAREAHRLGAFERTVVRHAKTTLVVNEKEKAALDAPPRTDVRVVPNGIDLRAFQPSGPASGEPRVVFCGVLDYPPNEAAAIRLATAIWPRVRRDHPEARLFLVGASPTERVRRLASDERGVVVTGAVPDVRPYLWDAAVSAAPIDTARGVQNKVLEALAAGLPVVTTPAVAAGLPDVARPGCVVASGDADMAEALSGLLRQSAVARHALAHEADLESLTWDRQLAPLLPILANAVRHAFTGAAARSA
jgi:sugar transferase (PEP-CTERM/EpsH1 system associated)